MVQERSVDMYYEDEYEEEDDYEEYCPRCGKHYERCGCIPESLEYCECGGLIDAEGNCPYCDYTPENDPHEVGEHWDWFDLLDIDDELRKE
jgi:hypothetical protein